MKKARILSLILASVMLLSLIPAIGVTASADGATVTKPTTLPDLAVEDADNVLDGVWKVYYGAHNNSDGSINTSQGRLPAGDLGELPATTQGKTFTTTTAWTGNYVATTSLVDNAIASANAVAVPANATGLLVKVTTTGANGHTGVRFNPTFTTAANGTGTKINCENSASVATKYAYYFDNTNSVWRAIAPDHSYRVSDNFSGYMYIPFEAYASGSKAYASFDFEGMYLTSFKADYRWDASSFTVESIEYVVVNDTMPTTLPDHAVENADNVKDGVYKAFAGIHNNANGTINTNQGRLDANAATALPLVTQGKAFTTTSVWTGSLVGGTSYAWQTLTTGVQIPNDGVGLMIKVKAHGSDNTDNSGVRFNPKFSATADGTSTYWGQTTKNEALYYYDSVNSVWRAFESGHTITVPKEFHGYIYIPFEALFNGNTCLTAGILRGMYVKELGIDYRWNATGAILESVDIVSVSDDLPTRLPNPSYTAGTADNKEGIWKTDYAVHNNADGTIVTTAGRLEADAAGVLPAATQGQAYKTTLAWSGSFAATTGSFTEAQATMDTAVAVPAGAVGMLVKVDASGARGDNALRFNPDFYTSAEDTTVDFQCVTDGAHGGYAYYYDVTNSVWRASAATHSYRVPDEFNGYIYIPFETYLTYGYGKGVAMDSELVKDMYLKGFRIAYGWGGTSLSIESVSFVSIAGLSHASITLDSNLNLNVYATVMDASSVATMTITPENTDLEAKIDMEGVYVADLDAYRFTYEDILPKYMTENFSFELTVDGAVVATKDSYSIRTYCENMLAKIGDTDPELKTLLTDILNYGAAAQTKAGHKTDDLANKNIDSTAGTDVTSKNPAAPTGAASSDENNAMTSASLRLENAVVFRLNLKASDISKVNVSVSGLGTTLRNYNGDAIKPGATAGTYYVMIDDIYATQFGNQITVTMSVNGVPVQALTFSVNAYLAAMTDAAWADVVDSVYAYGQSASAYANAKKNS